ncbi:MULTISPECIES: hypothetical protein [unclassified Streptomyces]|uniref:hypothetical protein n=1 Tax=unclassified Streptomyces TaxID=2593676 RepID=UPI0038029761
MIYRNVIAPSRAFTQFSHELIRHPRLSSDAVRLLTWQLSLPQDARESLSKSAGRARIGACSFSRAKRQLKEEGFVHERKVQGAGGHWVTQQLVSSTPLTSDEAVKILAKTPLLACANLASPQVVPSPPKPAAGGPTTPSTDRHPKKDLLEDTSNPPPVASEGETVGPTAEASDGSPSSPSREEARTLVGSLPLLSPALRHIPPGMRDELTRLAARWLDAGHASADVHEHVLRGLPGAGTPVHRPGGLVRYLLCDVPPRALPPRSGSRLSARLEGTRECGGNHIQPMLFRPLADETLCAECATRGPNEPGSVAGAENVRVPS